MTAFYNEIDPIAAQWLRNLIAAGHIAPGVVDTRSIEDILPHELIRYTQCHFFAGIGVWSLALRRAGWPDDRPVWTGSCPCQPFSTAGAGMGFADERHLWPAFNHLIGVHRPPVVFGEQVASKDVDPWIDLVQADLEALGYAVGAVAFPSAGVGAPHIRDRTYWLADANGSAGRQGSAHVRGWAAGGAAQPWAGLGGGGVPERMAHAGREGLQEQRREWDQPARSAETDVAGGLGHTHHERRGEARDEHGAGERAAIGCVAGGLADDLVQQRPNGQSGIGAEHETDGWLEGAAAAAGFRGDLRPGPTNGLWAAADWLLCRDGKWRPVEPGTFPLAHGAPARVGRLRAYGNAINASAAQAFIECYLIDAHVTTPYTPAP